MDLRRTRTALAGAACIAAAALAAAPAHAEPIGDNSKRVCAYSAHSIAKLQAFGAMVGRDIDCAWVASNANPTWATWEKPWFITHGNPDLNWAHWATAPGTSRTLVITLNLFPDEVKGTDWLGAGSRGEFADHARKLAANLVAAGLGDSVLRLSPEANGNWYSDSLGTTPAEWDQWREFWRQTVLAMKSVPGAQFRFDWCVNAHYRPIPLDAFYPGDDVVDYVGIDAYDSGVTGTGAERWPKLFNQVGGLGDVLNFAKAHDKPLSLPEWGVGPPGDSFMAGGDDPSYVDGIASVVRNNRVAYQSYFSNHGWATQLADGPLSLAAYQSHFGADGDSVGGAVPDADGGASAASPTPAPVNAARGGAPAPVTAHPSGGGSTVLPASVRRRARAGIARTARAVATGLRHRRHRPWSAVRAPATAPLAGRACVFVFRGTTAKASTGCALQKGAVATGRRTFKGSGAGSLVVRRAHRSGRVARGKLTVVAVFRTSEGTVFRSVRRIKLGS